MGDNFNEEELVYFEPESDIQTIAIPMYVEVFFTSGLNGTYFQKVVNGSVVDIIDSNGTSQLPLPHDCNYYTVTGQLLVTP